MEADEPVTVYTVNNPYEAEVIKMALQGEGISCQSDGRARPGFRTSSQSVSSYRQETPTWPNKSSSTMKPSIKKWRHDGMPITTTPIVILIELARLLAATLTGTNFRSSSRNERFHTS